jgi:hypothetical protein
MRTNVGNAVSLTGGAGAFFRKAGATEYQRELSATVRGHATVRDEFIMRGKGSIAYEYSFVIRASERFDNITFSGQSLRIRSTKAQDGLFETPHNEPEWDFVLNFSSARKENNGVELLGWNYDRLPPTGRSSQSSLKEVGAAISGGTSEFKKFENVSLLLIYEVFRPSIIIIQDIIGGETLNIDPHEVKKPEDSARAPGIQSNGSGLSATLWHLQRDELRSEDYIFFLPFIQVQTWPGRPPGGWSQLRNQLQSLVRQVNPEILSLHVDNDHFDNQLKARIKMKGPAEGIELPLSAMSDGTLKWCSLVTAILTHRAIMAIEEPENFLHPYMQGEVLKIMRETTLKKRSFVIMTTHSESLINAANPEELLVVSMREGVTQSRRISNARRLRREIQETGFGLGNYYLAGDLADA